MQSLIQKKDPEDKASSKTAVKPEKKTFETKKEAKEDKQVKNKHKT